MTAGVPHGSGESARHGAGETPVMVWVTEPDGWCSYLSDSWYAFTGQSPETGLGYGWLDATHPDDRAEVERLFKEATDRCIPFRAEYRLCRADGQYRWAIDAATPRLDETGAFLGYIGSVIDITERRQTEQRLLESEAHLAAVYAQTSAGLAETDPTGRFVAANDRYCQLVGRSREDLLGLRMQDITHPDDLPGNLVAFERLVATGAPFSQEKRYVRPDGSIVWVTGSITRVEPLGKPATVLAAVIDITERKRAEAALTEREAQLSLFIENAPASIAMFDRDMRYVAVSRRFLTDNNLPPGTDLTGRSHYDVFPDIPPRWRAIHERVLAGETQSADADLFARADGRTEWLRWRMEPWRDAAGQVGGVLLFAEMMTDRMRTEAALREALLRFEAARKASRLGIYDYDLKTGRLDWDERLRGLWGLAADDPVDYGVFIAGLHPDDRAPTQAAVERALDPRGSGEYAAEFRVLGRQGGPARWVAATGRAFFQEGEAVRLIGTAVDVTERREAEEALAAQRTQLRTILETVPVGIVLAELPSGRIVEGNSHVERQLGHPVLHSPDIHSYDEWVSYHADGTRVSGHEYPLARMVMHGEEAPEIEVHYQRGDGTRVWTRIMGRPVRNEAGDLIGGVVALVDIDAERRAQAALHRAAEELERQVQERTAQLVQSQKMEAIGQLTGGVAHDFNNLLQGIGSFLYLLRDHVPQGDPRRLYEAALQSVERGGRLTQALLAFARRQTLTPRPTDVHALLEAMRPLLERTLGGQIRFGIDVAPGTAAAQVDPAQLESAVLNLVINARDAMPEGGTLWLRVGNATIAPAPRAGEPDRPAGLAPGAYVTVRVEDTGGGMDAATLARVFEPFFTTKGVNGSGLGLSMVHGMAAQSGGGVHVASTPGAGTAVTLYLPRARPAEPEAPPLAAEGTKGAGQVILLVDDDAIVRIGIKTLMEGLGYRVVDADRGEAALDILREGAAVDALVTDYAMPGMNGAAVIQEARRLAPGLPALIITGYADVPGFAEDVGVLHKPFPPRELETRVAAILRRPHPADAAWH